jgi:hypothetical protein
LLKNNCQINEGEEDLQQLSQRRGKKEIEINRLKQQLQSRVPKSRDLTGNQWLETLETATDTVPESEEQFSF